MPKFRVEVQYDVLAHGYVEVSARDPKEASQKVYDLLSNGHEPTIDAIMLGGEVDSHIEIAGVEREARKSKVR